MACALSTLVIARRQQADRKAGRREGGDVPAAPNSAISHLDKIPNGNIGSYHVKSGFPGFATTPSYITAVSASNSIVSGLVFSL